MTMVARSKIITFGRRELLIKSALVRLFALPPILNLLLRLQPSRSVLKPPGEPTSAADMRHALLQDLVQIVEGRVGRAFVASVLVLEGQELQHAGRTGSAGVLQGGRQRPPDWTARGLLRHSRLSRPPDLRLRYFNRPAVGALFEHRQDGIGSRLAGVLVGSDHVRWQGVGHIWPVSSGASFPDRSRA